MTTLREALAELLAARDSLLTREAGARYRMLVAWCHAEAALAAQPEQEQPERMGLDAIRAAIEDRDAIEAKYHDLAENMVYHGNSVAWWHSKATAYRDAVGKVWDELKAAGIVCDGKKTCADGVRELAAQPAQEPAPRNVIESLGFARSRVSLVGSDTCCEYLEYALDDYAKMLAAQPAQERKSLDWPPCPQINSGVLCGVPRKPDERLCPDCNPQPAQEDKP